MIFKRRLNATLLVLLCSTFVATERSGDFKLNSDDLQVVHSDSTETVITSPSSRYFYSKEIAQCPSGESKMMLTLLLQSLKWSDVGEKKKEKAIKKMSRFFLVPVKYIKLDDIHTTEMLEMLKHSINKSNNLLNTKDAVGRIEFMIGCGDKLFASGKTIAHRVNDYVKSGKLEELSGMPIHWWNIWSKHVKSRVQRTRRQATNDLQLEGSGEYTEDEDYYEGADENDGALSGNENENENEDIDAGEDEDIDTNDDLPLLPSSAAAANARNNNQRKKQNSKKKTTTTTTTASPNRVHSQKVQDDDDTPSQEMEKSEDNEKINVNNKIDNNDNEEDIDSDYQISPEEPLMTPIDERDNSDDMIKEDISVPDEITTQRTSENVIDSDGGGPTPIGTSEIIKLEKEVDKTIENANNVGDVPPPFGKQQDDKILEEFVHSMIPNTPNQDMTTNNEFSTLFTTTEAYRINQIPETVTTTSESEGNRLEIQLSTIDVEDILNELHTTMKAKTTTVNAPEAETIFTPINNNTHNEHIIDEKEKLPIVILMTEDTISIVPSTLTTTTSSASILTEKESIMIEENTTTATLDSMPSFSSPSSSSSSPFLISSTSHEHETTYNYPITTYPTIITTTSAEITTSILTSTEPSITDFTTTSTLRNVDATIAFVAVDKATPSPDLAKSKEERKSEEESNYDDEYDDDENEEENFDDIVPSRKPSTVSQTPSTSAFPDRRTQPPLIPTSPDEDDDDDDEETEIDESVLQHLSSSTQQPTTTLSTTTTISIPSTTVQSTTPEVTSDNSNDLDVTSDSPDDYDVHENQKPVIVKRIKKIQATAGKVFSYRFEGKIFEDEEDEHLRLELLDKDENPLPSNSWIRFDPKREEIYGLPLENDVSRHEFKLRAQDKEGLYVDENVDVTVQQHKTYRSVNHEIFIQLGLEKKFESDVDWKIHLIRGIVEALDDNSTASIIVRDVTQNKYDPRSFTFSYTNDTLPKEYCPKAELDKLMLRLTKQALNDAMRREITVRNVEKDLINSCAEITTPRPPPSQPNNKQNFPPTLRNQIDKIEATVGQLLVYEVPKDTFYDPEDLNDLKLTLLNEDRSPLDPSHWLQFDSKNQEFYGVPTVFDKTQTYVLVAEDKGGLTRNDALVVEVSNNHSKRDYSAVFEYQLEIGYDQFQNAAMKRKFIERIQKYFKNSNSSSIVIKSVRKIQYSGRTAVAVQNATLHSRVCPENAINEIKDALVWQDGSLRDGVKQAIGSEFNVQKINVSPVGKCTTGDTYHHPDETSSVERPEERETPLLNQDVLITYVLPTAIILLMLLIALLIACLLYKRRNTGKMELGDEEERKSFRSKGIPVIFQDELDEKPEIITKSPVILKDEKPPLLPQYNGMSQDGEEDVDQYIPPQPLLMGNRESRGKSPVTPSYRKPPPYVSP